MGHFLWNCPVYSERCALFLEHLKNNLGNEFEHFKDCDIAGKAHFILGTELWGSRYEELLCLVKSYIIDIWELRKSKLYGRSVFRVRGPWPKRYGYHLSIGGFRAGKLRNVNWKRLHYVISLVGKRVSE